MSAVEPWLRGPVPGVNPYLTPIVHGLTQALEEVERAAAGLVVEQVWTRPGGAASVGYHLRHLAGSTSRLIAYAQGRKLTADELAAIRIEGEPGEPPATASALLALVRESINAAIEVVRNTPQDKLLEPRSVGRAALPSNVLGLLAHASEHAQRHAGQVVTTAKIVTGR
jgi:hypothetical protein